MCAISVRDGKSGRSFHQRFGNDPTGYGGTMAFFRVSRSLFDSGFLRLASASLIRRSQIAIAVVMEGSEPNVSYHGATYAAPVVKNILQAWKNKAERLPEKPVSFKLE